MRLVAECLHIERAVAAPQFGPQRREPLMVDSARAQEKPVRALLELEVVAGFRSERIQDMRRKGHLTLRGDAYQHNRRLLTSSLPE